MKDIAEEKFNRSPKGDNKPNSWTLLDFGKRLHQLLLSLINREFINKLLPKRNVLSKRLDYPSYRACKAMYLSCMNFLFVWSFWQLAASSIQIKFNDAYLLMYRRITFELGGAEALCWIAGDVVVHIFLPKERAFYNLEEFYGNATLVSLPFENRTLQWGLSSRQEVWQRRFTFWLSPVEIACNLNDSL